MVDGSTYANLGYDIPQWDTFHKEANCTDIEITIGNIVHYYSVILREKDFLLLLNKA
jgi:hypothetical protein